jgi:dihydroorotate dehydrogenase
MDKLKFYTSTYLRYMLYSLLRNALFKIPPERAHYTTMNILQKACNLPFVRDQLSQGFSISHPSLSRQLFGLTFKNPVGLGAGFDKNAKYLNELTTLGFGFVEIGTVTPKPQAGNERPRLFRLLKDKALINRMGFNNDGVEVITERLKQWRTQQSRKHTSEPILIGGNIGKNKLTPNEEAWKDYETCFHALHPYVDFFIVNVSSPNTPGLRALQEKDALHQILTHLQEQNKKYAVRRPVLLKIAPDLTTNQLDDVIALAQEIHLDGLVATNTTINREGLYTNHQDLENIGTGGLSGAPLRQRATEVVRYLHQQTGGVIPIIGSGGVFTGSDAQEKIAAGASLVEVWTGFIYEGPYIVRNICKSLIR